MGSGHGGEQLGLEGSWGGVESRAAAAAAVAAPLAAL
jgi:hypothetical protein